MFHNRKSVLDSECLRGGGVEVRTDSVLHQLLDDFSPVYQRETATLLDWFKILTLQWVHGLTSWQTDSKFFKN